MEGLYLYPIAYSAAGLISYGLAKLFWFIIESAFRTIKNKFFYK